MPSGKEKGAVEGLLSRFTDLLAAHPTAAVASAAVLLLAAMVWAVLASSYRYR